MNATHTQFNLTSYEIIRHGVDGSQYFQGCGTCFTDFDFVQTGIGSTEKEAFDDALECIATSESFTDGTFERIEKEVSESEIWDERDVQDVIGASDEDMEDSECYWHVSIRYNVTEIL